MRSIFIILALTAALTQNQGYAQRKGIRDRIDQREDGVRKNFLLALKQYRDKKPDAAERILEETMRSHPDHLPSVALLAKIKTETGQLKQAKLLLTRAFKLAPNRRSLHVVAAQLAFKSNQPLKALDHLNRAGKQPETDDESDDSTSDEQVSGMKKLALGELAKKQRTTPDYYKGDAAATSTSIDASQLPKVEEPKRLRLAVFAFEVKSANSDSTVGGQVGEMMTTSMVQTNCFKVVERQNMDKILAEQDFQLSDAVETETAVQVGQLMGIDAIVIGQIVINGSQPELDGRIVNVATGAILCAGNARSAEIRSAVNALTVSLTKSAYK